MSNSQKPYEHSLYYYQCSGGTVAQKAIFGQNRLTVYFTSNCLFFFKFMKSCSLMPTWAIFNLLKRQNLAQVSTFNLIV